MRSTSNLSDIFSLNLSDMFSLNLSDIFSLNLSDIFSLNLSDIFSLNLSDIILHVFETIPEPVKHVQALNSHICRTDFKMTFALVPSLCTTPMGLSLVSIDHNAVLSTFCDCLCPHKVVAYRVAIVRPYVRPSVRPEDCFPI